MYFVLTLIYKLKLCFLLQDGSDACTGDGGGPLLCPLGSEPGRFIQVGVVSWGIGCGSHVPGVYADLTKLVHWIKVWPISYAGPNKQGRFEFDKATIALRITACF